MDQNIEVHLELTALSSEMDYLKVSGPLETGSFEEVERVLNEIHHRGVFKIIISFSEVTYVSSSVISSIMAILRRAEENAGGLVIISSSRFILKTFDLVAGGLVPFAKDLEEAKQLI